MKKLAGFLGVCLLVLVSSQSSVVAQTFTNPSYCPKEKIKEKFPFSSPLLAITVNGTQIYLEPFCYRELEGGRIEIDPNWEQANIIELDVGMQLPLPTGGKVNKIRVHREAAPAFRKAFELIRQKGLESFIKTFDGTFVPRHINWNPTKPLSYHSWGIAIDLNAQENPLGGPASEGNIKLWEEAFDPAGFNWLGPNYDPMHFELPVTIVSSSPALPPPPTPPSEQTPYISGVSPDQPSAQPSRQWLTVRGSGFVPDSQVILSIGGSSYPIPPDRTRFVSPTQIDVYVGLTESGTWTIQVVNPGGRYSNTFSFQVIPTVGQPPFGARPAPYQCSQPSHYISMKEAANYALAAGFRGEAAAVIVAIAWAESDGNRYACRYNPPTDKNPTGSWDRGILQINDYWHSEITDDQAFDPARAFQAAYSISKGGTDFGDWCAYWLDCKKRIGKGQGRYRQHLDAARQAIQEITNPPVGDSDHDGIPDSQDRCPYEPGPSWNGGCPTIPPVPDSDNDGIPDGQDQCPYEPGPSWNNGCPEVSPPLPRNQPPIAWFTFSPINPSIGQPVRFDASSSFDPDPGDYITQYRWDFNDDRIFDVDGPIAYHTFSYSASYQVTLMVVDSRGAASFQHQVISVSGSITPPPPLPPVADSDNDGIPDSQDRCPYQPGPSWNSGCPEDEDLPPPPPPLEDDSDNDGIPDSQDRCPYEPGPRENKGCPVASAPFIKDWLLCGPFPYSPGTERSTHDNNFIGETTVQPRAGDACGRGVWQTHYGMNDYIDFNNIFMPNEYTVAYAHVYINSPRTQNVQLRLGSDDSIKAWLNGSLVHNNYILRPPAQDQDIVNVTLNAGWNRLLIKVLEVGGDWGFYARFTNTDGSEVQGLTYQLDNPTPSRRDSDGDGIPDGQDRCPYQPGPSWNGGCPEDTGPPPPPLPEGDSDHDGIPDSQDRCPYQPGPSWNGGCPVSSPPPPSSGSKTIEAALDTNGNRILDDDEILRALQYWSSGEEVPGTDGQTIDDAKMLELLHIWASRRPISPASAQSRSIQIGRAESLKVREIKLSPNPVKSTHPATFRAEGSGIAGIKVEVFNLEGIKVFEEEASGNTLRFYAVANRGRPLANGVYLYVVRVRGFDGREYISEVRKLVILR